MRPDLFDVLLLVGLAALAAGVGCAAYLAGGTVAAAAGSLVTLGLALLTIGVQGKRGAMKLRETARAAPQSARS